MTLEARSPEKLNKRRRTNVAKMALKNSDKNMSISGGDD